MLDFGPLSTSTRRAKITAVSHYLPERRVTNRDLEKVLDTNARDEALSLATIEKSSFGCGIVFHRIMKQILAFLHGRYAEALDAARLAEDHEEWDQAFSVYKRLLEKFPELSGLLQTKIGARKAWGFDLSGACSGFLYALATATQFITGGTHKKILVVGADVMTSIIDFQDRATCVLFGDGAGAVLVEPAEEGEEGIIDFILRSDGDGGRFLYMPAGGSLNPSTADTVKKRMHYVHQDGKNVFKFAVRGMADVSQEMLDRHKLNGKDLKLYVPHQANLRIIRAAVERMELKESQVAVNIDKYANTTAGTIPICLSEAHESKRLVPIDLVLLASFGAGFTWGSLLLRWEI